ncbi:P-loop containing nucleoside triphosphate hydrolase protein [Armillaria novae-zelandiae]|uniref:DNA 3'-5' helicase n=1 Tax=Armillaria novae-zelandiae TaxID=153914 RepID=A0AA39T886_9AGAR|nr:P-loop containing nucleoside triphosphate hydrolase protein [Armillaria novae-zelandiae]
MSSEDHSASTFPNALPNPHNPSVNSPEWLEQILKEKCHVPSLREFQLKHAIQLNDGRDLFLVVATGQGKTLVMYSPVIASQAQAETGIAISIVPTKALAEQHEYNAKKYGLHAIAITEDTLRDAELEQPKRDLFSELANGNDVQVGVLSPQMINGDRFRPYLRSLKFLDTVKWILVDEAHLVDPESAPEVYATVYKVIRSLWTRLKSQTTWCAVTGTATPSHAPIMAKKLGFLQGHYEHATYSLDRPNINFVIPYTTAQISDITKQLIFVSKIHQGYLLQQYLDSLITHVNIRLPCPLPHSEQIVMLYNLLMPINDRRQFIHDFDNNSTSRIGIVTDTITYGLDVDVDNVIVLNLWVGNSSEPHEVLRQRIGHPGRHGQPATAITYAPSWVQDVPVTQHSGAQAKKDAKQCEQLSPVKKGWYNHSKQHCPQVADLNHFGTAIPSLESCHCLHHQPLEGSDPDLDGVEQWKKHFKCLEIRGQAETVRANRDSFPALSPSMKESLTRLLIVWRSQTALASTNWDADESLGLTGDFLLPPFVVQHIVDHAHVCTSIEWLQAVAKGWEHTAVYAEALFNYLLSVMKEHQQMFWEDSAPNIAINAGSPTITEDTDSAITPNDPVITALSDRINFVLHPVSVSTVEEQPIEKRPPPPGNSTRKKRACHGRRPGKENAS